MPIRSSAAAGTGTTNRPHDNDVTAALFLLLRTQDITSEVFTCPSSNAEKDIYGGGTNAPLNRVELLQLQEPELQLPDP